MAVLDLSPDQVVEGVTDDDLARALSAADLADLRRRHPPGSGEFLLRANGEIVFHPTGARHTFTVPEANTKSARRAIAVLKHRIDTSV
ncbi:MAG: hypothetical protein MI806_11160 [Minwuiales bacterium]|nr:hypothetical protein [Minwuiales bacterium]